MATYVLGVGLSHDGSACLLRDGRVAVAIEKERVTRRKHDGLNDADAVNYCLEAEGIRARDLSLIVQNANFSMFEQGNAWFEGPRSLPADVPVVTISHHLAHAYSAIGTCPFDRAAVLVVDGCGNAFDETMDREGAQIPERPSAEQQHMYFEKDSYYFFDGESLSPLLKDYSIWGRGLRRYPMHPPTTLHSIGGVYAAASMYSLFGMDDPGKLMGLAPYGRAGVHDFEIFETRDGRIFVRYDWMRRFGSPNRRPEDLARNFQEHADLAYWVQREVERALLYLVRSRYDLAPCENLAYAGGVALNAVANARILAEGPFENLYVQPAAGDNGLAIGCAYYGWMKILGRKRIRHDGTPFLGRRYDARRIEAAIAANESALSIETPTDVVSKTAELLASGAAVAWFQGGSEFGPRALGHRSILADPRPPSMHARINRAVKFREDFRPFAPSVPVEDAPRYFETDRESPYMLRTASVRDEYRDRIPSVVHRDGSCRVQTVSDELDARFHRLHREFERLTGVAVLLNTSFNRRGTPIVETPEEAVEFFLTSGLDVLVLDRFVLTRKSIRTAESAKITDSCPERDGPTPDFIAVYPRALSEALCATIVKRFEESGEARAGRVGSGVDPTLKRSLDISLDGRGWQDLQATLVRAALPCLVSYVRDFPGVVSALSLKLPAAPGRNRILASDEIAVMDDRSLGQLLMRVLRPGAINLQKYQAGHGGYPRWHSETFPLDGSCETLHRLLFFTFYLTDVSEGGETEFLFQRRKVTPVAGTLLIAPAGFTHTHRGNTPLDRDKYIATSWFLFQRAEALYGRPSSQVSSSSAHSPVFNGNCTDGSRLPLPGT
jgi:carbamoyltransferase